MTLDASSGDPGRMTMITKREPMTPTDADDAVRRRGRLGGTAGLVAGPLFIGLIVLTTIIEWRWMHENGWSAVHDSTGSPGFPSGLATGPQGILQTANFFLTGCLVLAFGAGLVPTLVRGASRVVFRVAITLIGIALLLSSFTTDFSGYVPNTDPGPTTWHGWIHDIAFYVVMFSALAAGVSGARAMWRTPAWRRWSMTALVLVALIPLLIVLPTPWAIYVVLTLMFTWVSLTGLWLRRLCSARPAPSA